MRQWSVLDFIVEATDANIQVVCRYCHAVVPHRLPEYSDRLDDVIIEPNHECPNLPEELPTEEPKLEVEDTRTQVPEPEEVKEENA